MPNIEDLTKLLLSIDQEELISRKNPTNPIYRYSLTDGDQKITIAGNGHIYTWNESLKEQYEFLDNISPDLVIYEGDNTYQPTPEQLEMDKEEIAEKWGEQGISRWWAAKNNVDCRGWDISNEEWIEAVVKMNVVEQYICWIIAHNVRYRHVRSNKQLPKEEFVQKVLQHSRLNTPEDFLNTFGIELTTELIDSLGEKYTGVLFSEMDEKTAELHSSPRKSGPVTDHYRRIRELREEHAIKVILDAKNQGYMNIFVSCGSSHAVTWSPSIEKLYPDA